MKYNKCTVRPALLADAALIAPKLREADINEIAAMTGQDPQEALEQGIVLSKEPYVIEYKGHPIAVFGVCPCDDDLSGVVWLLGTDEISEVKMEFLRHSREWLAEVQKPFKVIWNLVDLRNELHIKWLEWLEFTFLKLHDEWGVEKRPFYEFAKVTKHV